MPTISVIKGLFFEELGETFSRDAFEDLCFSFGLELDEWSEDPDGQLKIEVPANRCDLLCHEGLAMNLNVFRGTKPMPVWKHVDPPEHQMVTVTATAATALVRPLLAAAILRGVTFGHQAHYDSFISLQDKLHQNLARQRTLVSIGTHDLAKIQPPFTYEALPKKDIVFVPLNQTKRMNGEEIINFYETNDKTHIGKYTHIIRDSPIFPVILDANRTVCSLPPIINSEHSKISLGTSDIFIDVTATDGTKLEIVLDTIVTMFSKYCAKPFTVEPVQIISPHNSQSRITPLMRSRAMEADISYLNGVCGLSESPASLCNLLARMGNTARPAGDGKLAVLVPPTRTADIIHQVDLVEEVAIAYNFNRLPRSSPNKSVTIGSALAISRLGDIFRLESASAGWSEVLPLILCSHDENFAWLNRVDDGTTAVRLANPKSAEYQIARTSLLPGLLLTLRENKSVRLPLQIFETSDVVLKDPSCERRARNERRWAAAYCGRTSGFEIVHGLLDRVMLMINVPFVAGGEEAGADGYWLDDISDQPTFFPGRAAAIRLRQAGRVRRIGEIGVLDPSVLDRFELKYPVSTVEMNIEVFL